MKVSNLHFEKDAVRDFVVNVNASQSVKLTDKFGKTSDASKI